MKLLHRILAAGNTTIESIFRILLIQGAGRKEGVNVMEEKRYRWLWWVAIVIVLAGLIWYAIIRTQTEEYVDGTLVWNPTDAFCMSNRSYCHLSTIPLPSSYGEGGLQSCQKLSI